MSVRSRVELLRQIPLFADAADAHLQLLAFAMERIAVPADKHLIRQGERRQTAYIVVKGQARVDFPEDPNGPETVGPGTCIGEIAMLADLPYSFSVIALTDLECLQLTRELFYRVAEEFPDFAEIALDAVTRRIDATCRDLQNVARLFKQARSFSNLP
jgi:CRP-like cAMP-binding protein